MEKFQNAINVLHQPNIRSIGLLAIGVVLGFLVSYGWAAMTPPTELKGHILLLRRITINPGGQIAKHSAATTPAVVYMESGTWTEGRDSGETEHSAGDTFIEDKDTVHWFYNRGNEPAAALVCDIKAAA